ncbi:hypothetical protein B9Z55_006602 [Caenorhabditis nigoni]|uniref:Uncharacterized protein n=1 Tax=Caenorhabditis nigoni TaxID=1611254 RepID=A0A2G5V5Y3_9PELO|nr:hypothetical protein B9Z55_006602 [Caenorhabditis nigoni]
MFAGTNYPYSQHFLINPVHIYPQRCGFSIPILYSSHASYYAPFLSFHQQKRNQIHVWIETFYERETPVAVAQSPTTKTTVT